MVLPAPQGCSKDGCSDNHPLIYVVFELQVLTFGYSDFDLDKNGHVLRIWPSLVIANNLPTPKASKNAGTMTPMTSDERGDASASRVCQDSPRAPSCCTSERMTGASAGPANHWVLLLIQASLLTVVASLGSWLRALGLPLSEVLAVLGGSAGIGTVACLLISGRRHSMGLTLVRRGSEYN
jgi:hypothetical protein